MLKLWEKSPQLVGMIAGLVALPLLWWLQERLLSLVFRSGSMPTSLLIFRYTAMGAIPGAIIGAGMSKAAFAWRQGNWKAAKWHLLRHGGVVFTLFVLFIEFFSWQTPQSASQTVPLFGSLVPAWFGYPILLALHVLPFQLAILLLFLGFLMRSRPSKPA